MKYLLSPTLLLLICMALSAAAPAVAEECLGPPSDSTEAETVIIENQCRILRALAGSDPSYFEWFNEPDVPEEVVWQSLTLNHSTQTSPTEPTVNVAEMWSRAFDPCGRYGMCLPWPTIPPGVDPCSSGGDESMCLNYLMESLQAACVGGCDLGLDSDYDALPPELQMLWAPGFDQAEYNVLRGYLSENPHLVAIGQEGFALLVPNLTGQEHE